MIIGLTGAKGAGKDTAAEMLTKRLASEGIFLKRVAFADRLKEEVAQSLGISVSELNANKAKYRRALQFWGTEFKRELVDDNYWINEARKKIVEAKDAGYSGVVITDVRFPNEFQMIREYEQNIVFGVWKRKYSRLEFFFRRFRRIHASERYWPTFANDCVLLNEGSLQDLADTVDNFADDVTDGRFAFWPTLLGYREPSSHD